MKETILQRESKLPFSLHDTQVNDIYINGEEVHLSFKDGFKYTEPPYKRADGSIVIKGVDFDFAVVHLLR